MSVTPRICYLFAQEVRPIIQANDDAEGTRKIISRVFRMWSGHHKLQDAWFPQKHHFLGLNYGSVLAQGGKSAQGMRTSQGRSYLQPPGKVSKGASCVAVDSRSTAPPWATTPLSSLSFSHHYCQTIQVRSMWAEKYVSLFSSFL